MQTEPSTTERIRAAQVALDHRDYGHCLHCARKAFAARPTAPELGALIEIVRKVAEQSPRLASQARPLAAGLESALRSHVNVEPVEPRSRAETSYISEFADAVIAHIEGGRELRAKTLLEEEIAASAAAGDYERLSILVGRLGELDEPPHAIAELIEKAETQRDLLHWAERRSREAAPATNTRQPQLVAQAPHSTTSLVPHPRTSGFAIASFVLSILWLAGVGTLLAIVFGHVSLRQIDRSRGALVGRRFAVAGLVIAWTTVALVALGLALLATS